MRGNIIIKFITLFFIILISVFFGYENPELIESTKSTLKKKFLNRIDEEKVNKIDEEKVNKINEEKVNKIDTDSQLTEIKANSFSLKLSKVKSFQEQSASLIISTNTSNEAKFKVFTRDGFLIVKDNKKKN